MHVFLDENGRNTTDDYGLLWNRCFRTVAAIAEQFNDEKGLVWPANMAPYQVHLIPVNMKDDISS